MADYYPLIAKAVAGLDKNTGEARRALYERARNALVTQLRGVTPALGESEITRERLALEEAIRRVEADAARKARSEQPAGRGERTSPSAERWSERSSAASRAAAPGTGSTSASGSSPPETADRTPPAGAGGPATPVPQTSPSPPSSADSSSPPGAPERAAGSALSGSATASPAASGSEPRTPRRLPGASLTDRGLKGFRDVLAEAESLGEATAQASKTAREAFAATAPSRDGTRIEPHVEPEALRPRREPPPLTREHPPFSREPLRRSSAGRDAAVKEAPPGREASMPPSGAPRSTEPVRAESADLDFAGKGGVRPYLDDHDHHQQSGGRPFPLQPEPLPPHPDGDLGRPLRAPLGGGLVKAAVALVAVLAVVGLGWWAWPTLSGLFGPSSRPVATAPAPAPADSGSRGKITDRVGSQPLPGARPQQDVPAVAQRVVLYEEDPADPGGKRFVGTAVWRTETVAAAPGQAPDMVVRADIEIPERNASVRWSLRRNSDRSLPASHTIEIMFTLPADFPNGGISNIPGILMKQAEQTRGVPLAGLAVKVTTGFFLIGLSSSETDMQRNLQLLKERAWFDVPVVYGNGRRAIMAIEKGTPGERAFADAFAAWGE